MAKAPKYGITGNVGTQAGKKSGGASHNVRMRVGPFHKGVYNLRKPAKGQFGSTKSTPLMVPEAWKWASVARFNVDMVQGFAALERQLTAWVGHIDKQSVAILHDALVPAFDLSKYYCPKDTWDLVNSAELHPGPRINGKASVGITYARTGKPYYAMFVHEIPTYFHAPPTSYKFLERALKQQAGQIQSDLAKYARRAAGSGGGGIGGSGGGP